MNKSKHTGTKLSEYPTSLSNKKHKLLYNHFFMSYAPVNFGISTVNKNYKIPIQAIRDDIKYYIGLENAKGDWQNMIHFWSGDWFNADKTKSYIYEWKYEERGSNDYISNKFGDIKDDEGNAIDDYDRIFFIKDAPIPLEEEHKDPNPHTNKFVNKKYIDDRFNGIRKVSVSVTDEETDLYIRPYSCVYEYDTTPTTINIVDTEKLQDGRKVADCIKGNILTFIIKFPANTDVLAIKANGEHNVKWSYPTEFQDIVKVAKDNNSDVWLQCYAGYTEDGLSIRCSSALHPMPGSHEPPLVTDKVTDGDSKVPTSDAVYDFVKDEISKIIIDTTDTIEDDSQEIPTSDAVYEFVDEKFETIDKLFEKWHSDNDYTHIKKNYSEAIGDILDNLSEGDEASGVIINLPETSTISEITVGGTSSNGKNDLDYQFYGKLRDEITGRVLATCIGSRATFVGVTVGVKFDFTKSSQQPYLIKDRNYRLTFHQTETSNLLDKKFYLAYANADLAIDIGKYSPKAIKSDGSIIFPPSKFQPAGTWLESDKRRCTGYKTLIRYETVSNKEFVDVTDEISNIYVALNQTGADSDAEINKLTNEFNGHVTAYELYTSTTNGRLNDLETHKTNYEKKIDDHINEYKTHVNDFNEHVLEETIHVTIADKSKWDGMLSNISEGNCISITANDNTRTISVKTDDTEVNSSESVPTSSVVYTHNTNKSKHLLEGQKEILFNNIETFSTVHNGYDNLMGEKFGGIVIEPIRDTHVVKLDVNHLLGENDNKIYTGTKKISIWQTTDEGIKFVHQFNNAEGKYDSYYGTNFVTCSFDTVFTFEKGNTYILTFHNASAATNPTVVQCGYVAKIRTYLPSELSNENYNHFAKIFRLNVNSESGTFTEENIDRLLSPMCKLYLEDAYKPRVMLSEDFNDTFDKKFEDAFEENYQTNIQPSITALEDFQTSATQQLTNITNNVNAITGNEEYLFNNYDSSIHTMQNHQLFMIVLTKKHFYTGKIVNLTLYHDSNADSSSQNGGYLVIQAYKELNNMNEVPLTYYSTNRAEYETTEDCYRFNFENCVLNDYAKVHICMVRDTDVVPAYKPTSEQCTISEGETKSKISKIRVACIKMNGSDNENDILDIDDECGIYWNYANDNPVLQNKLARIAVNKISSKLVKPFEFENEVEEESIIDIIPSSDISFGSLIKSNNTTHTNSHGIIINPACSGTFNQITILSCRGDNVDNYENVFLRIFEKQDDNTMVEIATSINPEECAYSTLTFTNVIYKFDNFNMDKNKLYYCEFVLFDTDGVATSRPIIKVGLIENKKGLGTINSGPLNTWGTLWNNLFTATYKVEIVGDYPITAETTKRVLNKFIITKDGSTTNNIILFPETVTSTIVKDCEYYIDGNSITISVPKTTGTNYVIFKQMYIDKDNNKSGELLKHYSITI